MPQRRDTAPGYIMAKKRSIGRGPSLSLTAAPLQASIAILLVGIIPMVPATTAATIDAVAHAIEIGSFAAIFIFGTVLVWAKAAEFVTFFFRAGVPDEAITLRLSPVCSRMSDVREFGAVVLAAGIRPCSER
jgi:ABC-type nickel/cobalt efflux system permease component RcnA